MAAREGLEDHMLREGDTSVATPMSKCGKRVRRLSSVARALA